MYYIYRGPEAIQPDEDIPLTDDEVEVLVHCLGNSIKKNAVYTWKGELTKQGEVLQSARDKIKSLVPPAPVIDSSQLGQMGE